MTKPKLQKCLCCKEAKRLTEYYLNVSGRNRDVTCKTCTDRAAGNQRQVEEENAGTTRATPRTIVGQGVYVPERGIWQRNYGNGHIPSRGLL